MKMTLGGEKEVSCRVTNSVLKYIESLGYDINSIIEGLPYSKAYLEDPFNWVTYTARETIFRRAAELVNDGTLMYRVGMATPKLKPLGGIKQMVLLLASPELAYKAVPKYSAFLDKVFKFKVALDGGNKATITMSLPEGYQPSKDACYYARGLLAAIPTLWELPPAEVHEHQCMCQPSDGHGTKGMQYGAKTCVFQVTWQPRKPLHSRLKNKLYKHDPDIATTIQALESNFQLLEQKNVELFQTNIQLARVREIALGLDTIRTVNEVLSLVVESARDIPGVRFVIVQKRDESGTYLTTPYYSKIRSKSVIKGLRNFGFDLDKQLGKNPTSQKLQLPIAKLKVAQDYRSNPRVIVTERLAELLAGVWPKTLCDSIQRIVKIKKFVVVPLLVDSKYWGNIVFFLQDEVSQHILEMVGVHCAIALKNVSTLETLETALNSLAESEEKLSLTIESLVEGIMVTDLQANILQVNDAVVRLHGCGSKEELIGKSAFELIARKDLAKAMKNMEKTLKVGHVKDTEYAFLTRDGREFPAEISTAVIRDANGKPDAIVATTRDITERKRAEDILRSSWEQLRGLSVHLQKAREKERSIIAREIHDELGQALTALKMDLSWLIKRLPEEEESLVEKTRAMSNLADRTIKTVKRISTQLRPGLLDDLGLIAAIEWQSGEFQERTGIKCKTRLDAVDAALKRELATDIFRIFQEVLTNIARHAEATMVKMSLKEKPGTLVLQVRDNGKGISEEHLSNPQSFGLLAMKERAFAWGGKVNISGSADKGTTVTVSIPLNS